MIELHSVKASSIMNKTNELKTAVMNALNLDREFVELISIKDSSASRRLRRRMKFCLTFIVPYFIYFIFCWCVNCVFGTKKHKKDKQNICVFLVSKFCQCCCGNIHIIKSVTI